MTALAGEQVPEAIALLEAVVDEPPVDVVEATEYRLRLRQAELVAGDVAPGERAAAIRELENFVALHLYDGESSLVAEWLESLRETSDTAALHIGDVGGGF